MEVTLGGERLGSGNKNKQYLHNYERSTHDLGYIWRSTMAAGTLVPFMSELALPGDTFDINLDCDILTHPTIGPLFGSYKVQLDVFQIPIRLYNAKLHMNMLGIGAQMNTVTLPQVEFEVPGIIEGKPLDNQQINSSALFSYLGIRGCGKHVTAGNKRQFNAVPYLAYWDIYKNYYANKQEPHGVVIHKDIYGTTPAITSLYLTTGQNQWLIPTSGNNISTFIDPTSYVQINFSEYDYDFRPDAIKLFNQANAEQIDLSIFTVWEYDEVQGRITGSAPDMNYSGNVAYYTFTPSSFNVDVDQPPKLATFDLNLIDQMRTSILQSTDPVFVINSSDTWPYSLPFQQATVNGIKYYSHQFAQEGLACKTYQSDLFNNWINTEWIDGANGINELTSIDTTGDTFTINEFMLSKKIYDMMTRIAVSGGSYDDWLDAVYTHERTRSAENPMYLGGLIKNLVFQEVISNAATTDQPLGTLAGRGRLGSKSKGGHIVAKIDEPSYIMGLISLTPNVDYSQGNKWDVNLKTLDDLHKPALDQIGFQDLITDQMAWWDTVVNNDGTLTTKSAGKQPAWINYMTNVNQVRGNFADETQQMFMVLNRSYEPSWNAGDVTIGDLTTYIDPSKFNHIFADTRLDAQNFWAQIAIDITARRKMSAKQIPNL